MAAGDWSNPSNWSGGEPSSSDNALISNGGTVYITSDGEVCYIMYVAESGHASGHVVMSGGSLAAQLESLGSYGTASFTQSGGENTINGGLTLGRFNTGTPTPIYGTGTYDLSNGTLSAWWETIGGNGTGTFDHTSGTNTIYRFGGLNQLTLGMSSLGNGTYNLGATGSLSAGLEYIGKRGTGTFNQTGGTNTASGSLVMGDYSGSEGTYNLNGGALTVDGTLVVGGAGSAEFNVTGDDLAVTVKRYSQNSLSTLNSVFDSDGIATIDVLDWANLSGTWNVIDPGDAPTGVFDIMTAPGGFSGVFDSVNLPGPLWSWRIYNETTLQVQHVIPEPSTFIIWSLLGALGITVGWWRRKRVA